MATVTGIAAQDSADDGGSSFWHSRPNAHIDGNRDAELLKLYVGPKTGARQSDQTLAFTRGRGRTRC